MNVTLPIFALIIVFAFSSAVWANESVSGSPKSLCDTTQVKEGKGGAVTLFQYRFDDGTYDLAMHIPGGDIKRVTFGGSSVAACYYKAMALASGGEWGWHLAWVPEDSMTLSYARMDGVAWVSSPTKRLSKHVKITTKPLIVTSGQKVWIVWGESAASQNNIYTVYSDDEGRYWNSPKLIMQASGTLDNLGVTVKEGKPYLQLNGNAEALLQE